MNQQSSIVTNDRESYNRYSREKYGTHPDESLEKAFGQYATSDIPGLFIKGIDGSRHILEIGAGCAFSSIIVRPHVESAIILDHNRDPVCGLEAAGRLSRTMNTPVIPVQGSYEHTPFHSSAFDAILAQSCIHHAMHPGQVIRETYRLLHSGGRLVIIEPCKGMVIPEKYAYRHYWKMPGMDPVHMHEHAYTLSTWINWLKEAGYGKIHVRTTFFVWAGAFLKRNGFVRAALFLGTISFLLDLPYIFFAFLFGHPPSLPHQFTKKITGFEYYEVLITARKL